MHPHWYMMTTIMPLCFIVCVTLTILQTKSLRWSLQSNKDAEFTQKRELLCLYGQYIIGGMCAVQCFLCHISNVLPDFYCFYGMSICVITYAATKSCLYGFFIERARCVYDFAPILPSYVWRYVFPSYIAVYFGMYLILCPLYFRGAVVDPNDSNVPTACLFGNYHSWVFDLSAGVDLLNCVLFLFLFIYPIYSLEEMQTADHLENAQVQNKAHEQDLATDLRVVIKYNVICSTICSVSSITFLFVMSFAKHGSIGYYLWFGGNIDIMINSICLFLMLGVNRRYLKYIWSKVLDSKGFHHSFIAKKVSVPDIETCQKPSASINSVQSAAVETPELTEQP